MKLSTSSYALWRVGTFVGVGAMVGLIALNVDWPLEAVCAVGAAVAVITALVLAQNKDKEIL